MIENREVDVTRVYHFSAAHQLANPARPAAENAALYGACHRAHGHNYYLEVTVAGAPDPRTGMAVDLEALDGHVRRTVIDQVDHAKLEDVPGLPTGRLSRITVVETAKNRFEYRGEDA